MGSETKRGVRDQDRLRASLVVPHPTIQFLGLQKFAVCS